MNVLFLLFVCIAVLLSHSVALVALPGGDCVPSTCGASAIIMVSDDDGSSWSYRNVPGDHVAAVTTFERTIFVSAYNDSVSSDNTPNVLATSTDAGKSWHVVRMDDKWPVSGIIIYNLVAYSATHICGAGVQGVIGCTHNAGQSWKMSHYSKYASFNSFSHYNGRLFAFGWIAAYENDPDIAALYSEDEGVSWHNVSFPFNKANFGLGASVGCDDAFLLVSDNLDTQYYTTDPTGAKGWKKAKSEDEYRLAGAFACLGGGGHAAVAVKASGLSFTANAGESYHFKGPYSLLEMTPLAVYFSASSSVLYIVDTHSTSSNAVYLWKVTVTTTDITHVTKYYVNAA